MNLVDQYREHLLKHARHPLRVGALENPDATGQCKNPLCGDHVLVAIQVTDGSISDLRIQASGCSISVASASMMSELAEGCALDEASKLGRLFNESLLSPVGSAWPVELSDLISLSRLRESPTRVPCALMGWFALQDAIKNL